ncbi:hypothetical protein F4811DRAFT_505445, partial [Daldinia bambusicola]
MYQSAVRELFDCRLINDDAPDGYFAKQILDKLTKPLSSCSAWKRQSRACNII